MFSNNARCLPSCNTYEGAVRIFERAASKPTPNWPVGTRPLDDRRKTQYAVIRDGNKIVFRLHNTNVVEWYGPTSMRLDSSWDSQLTRDFADNFIPAGIRFVRYRDEGYVLTYDTDKMMCRGIHLFTRGYNGVWLPDAARKPKRDVLDKDRACEINEELRDFIEWIKALWAVSGSDGHHPWVGQKAEWKGTYDVPATFGPDQYESIVCNHIARKAMWDGKQTHYVLQPVLVDNVLKSIRTVAYRKRGAYIQIDYDAPLPRRTKK